MSPPRVIVFLGPTLPAALALQHVRAEIRPPAAQGDIYRAACARPQAIGLIDGVFHSVPSVWHKEVLWALSQGIHVYGAASMGALRAAELHAFGMVGVGRIFEDFRDGVLEADDEVALVHGPAEAGWIALSEALVDIRATLRAAQSAGVLDARDAATLLALAQGLYYPDRSWDRLLPLAAARGLDEGALAALRAWLPAGRVSQKRADAIALLQALCRLCTPGLAPLQAAFHLEDSLYWTELQTAIDAEAPSLAPDERRVLDALRSDPAATGAAEAAALGWLLADERARAHGRQADAVALLAASKAFCARHGLQDEAAVERWLAEQGCARDDLHRLLTLHAHQGAVGQAQAARLDAVLLDWLRWSGDYRRWRDAAI